MKRPTSADQNEAPLLKKPRLDPRVGTTPKEPLFKPGENWHGTTLAIVPSDLFPLIDGHLSHARITDRPILNLGSLKFHAEVIANNAVHNISCPSGLAVDEFGTLYVVDSDHDRVLAFPRDGSWHEIFGGPGQFDGIMGVKFDFSGNLVAVDGTNGRLQVFELVAADAPGGPVQFKLKLSIGGHTEADPDYLDYPSDIAINFDGHYIVPCYTGHVVKFFTPEGVHTKTIGEEGDAPGQFQNPCCVATDYRNQTLLVVDQGNSRIQRFSALTGEFIHMFGSYGLGKREFGLPNGIAIDKNGTIVVADYDNSRVQVLSPEGEFITLVGLKGAAQPGELQAPASVLIDQQDRPALKLHKTYIVEGSFEARRPGAIALAPDGNIFIADDLRINVYQPDGIFLRKFIEYKERSIMVYDFQGLVFDLQGNLVLVDGSDEILCYDPQGNVIQTIGGTRGSADGEFNGPCGLAIDAQGSLLITDVYNSRVQIFNPRNGEFIKSFGAGKMITPGGVAVDLETGNIVVTERDEARIQVFSPEGDSLMVFAPWGVGKPREKTVFGITIDKMGHIIIATSGTDKLYILSRDGKLVRQLVGSGAHFRRPDLPQAVVIDEKGRILVTGMAKIQIWKARTCL